MTSISIAFNADSTIFLKAASCVTPENRHWIAPIVRDLMPHMVALFKRSSGSDFAFSFAFGDVISPEFIKISMSTS